MRANIFGIVVIISTLSFAQSLEPCRDDTGLFGYCDKAGSNVIKYQFYDALEFIDGHAAVLLEDKWGIINESGSWMVTPSYDEVYNCKNVPDQILVKEGENWSFINAYGIQMTHEYQVGLPWHEFELEGPEAHFQEDTWFSVIKKGKWGIIDIHDNIHVPFSYEWTRVLRRSVGGIQGVVAFLLKKKEKYAWQSVNAETPEGYYFDDFLGEYDDYVFLRQGDQSIILNAISGEYVDNPKREYFNLIDAEDSVGLVSAGGKIVVPFKYKYVDIGSVEGYVLFGSKYSKGIMNMESQILLQNEFRDIKQVGTNGNETLVAVKNQDNRVAVMVIGGESVRRLSEFKYDFAVQDGDKIKMKLGNKYGYLSYSGIETWN